VGTVIAQDELEAGAGERAGAELRARAMFRLTGGLQCFDQEVGEEPRGGLGGASGGVDGVQFHRLPVPVGQHRSRPPVLQFLAAAPIAGGRHAQACHGCATAPSGPFDSKIDQCQWESFGGGQRL
jgi:hypothetical protein